MVVGLALLPNWVRLRPWIAFVRDHGSQKLHSTYARAIGSWECLAIDNSY